MRDETENARAILESGSYTCVMCRGDITHTATERGVKPLLCWLDGNTDLTGFCAADRVVGRATAFLYCLLGVKEVYAQVMSRPAAQVLEAHGIAVQAGQLVDGIINRRGTGPCPFETAVMDIDNAREALLAIRAKLAQM